MRINIYRGQIDGIAGSDNADKVPNSASIVPDSGIKMPDSIERLPDNEQERQIYKYVLENGSITTSRAAELLAVKQRRARAVLRDMVEDHYLRKEGAARSTIYVNTTER